MDDIRIDIDPRLLNGTEGLRIAHPRGRCEIGVELITMYPDVKWKRIHRHAVKPSYTYKGEAGIVLSIAEDLGVSLAPGETRLVSTGIAIAIPDGFCGCLCPLSSVITRCGVTLADAPSIINPNYRGEILLNLLNTNRSMPVVLETGDFVAQLLILPVAHAYLTEVESLDDTERSTKGFGSSGRL